MSGGTFTRRSSAPRVLLVGPTPPPYHGVAVAMRGLLDAPWQERFATSHLDLADRRGIEHVNKPDVHDVVLFGRQWARMVSLLLRQRPHIVYVPISQSTLGFLRDSLLIWPAYLAGSRVVLHLHGGNFRTWFEQSGGTMRAYVRSVLRRVARVVVLGEALRGMFAGLVPVERIMVVPNGIDWRTRPEAGSSAARRSRPFRVLYLGTLIEEKGVGILLQAVARVDRVRQDAEFIFAGPWGSERNRISAEAFVAAQGLQQAVSFVGLVDSDAKRALLQSASLFVFPGIQQEGQPLVVIEAMAAGVPVLFTDRGCLRETVLDGEQGLEVDVGSADDLAEKILWMLAHPQDMQRMGASGRRRFETLFTQARFVADMQRVFAEVVSEPPRRRA